MRPNPSLYQINTRVTLRELSKTLARPATLDDISDATLDRLSDLGFEWVWLLGVWQTGSAGRNLSHSHQHWREEFLLTLPDLCADDICGSCFAISRYSVAPEIGGNPALLRLRNRLHQRGLSLLLDFVPNHTALDHLWSLSRPEFYIHGIEEQLAREPHNYTRLATTRGPVIFAYGRDPYFPGWPDTLQLNYAEPLVRQSMQRELRSIAEMCDGVRCDMAMLVLPDVFEKTWGVRPEPFWPSAIKCVRAAKPDFLFMAEVYWDLEWNLQQQGFDYTYDKRLYDRLRDQNATSVRDHFRADMTFQHRSVRFLENHDEPRAAATFPGDVHRAAAILTYLCPGLRFFHDGQLEGRKRKVSVHLGRRPDEIVDADLRDFYDRLLACLKRVQPEDGTWQLLDCLPAWHGNWTSDCFIAFAWQAADRIKFVAAVNYAPNQSQCYVELPFGDIRGVDLDLRDVMGNELYRRQGDDLINRGLYLDLPPWGYHVFEMRCIAH